MSMTDAVVSLVLLVVAAIALMYVWERVWPADKSAVDLGYLPESEAPPWGWPIAIALGMGVCGLLLFGPTMAARMIGI